MGDCCMQLFIGEWGHQYVDSICLAKYSVWRLSVRIDFISKFKTHVLFTRTLTCESCHLGCLYCGLKPCTVSSLFSCLYEKGHFWSCTFHFIRFVGNAFIILSNNTNY